MPLRQQIPMWDWKQCRRNKFCDWRCLSNPDASQCIGCERNRLQRPVEKLKTKRITVTVDGAPITCAKGTLIIDLLIDNDVELPFFCHHPLLEPREDCRFCLVEIALRGDPRLVPACSTRIETPIEISTSTQFLVMHLRQLVKELLAAAPMLEALRTLAQQLDIPLPPPGENHCILCKRCLRACSQVAEVSALLPIAVNENRTEMTRTESCTHCGACLTVCPTGAIPPLQKAPTAKTPCRLCELICPEMAISSDDDTGELRVDAELCKHCGLCAYICPENAISMVALPKE